MSKPLSLSDLYFGSCCSCWCSCYLGSRASFHRTHSRWPHGWKPQLLREGYCDHHSKYHCQDASWFPWSSHGHLGVLAFTSVAAIPSRDVCSRDPWCVAIWRWGCQDALPQWPCQEISSRFPPVLRLKLQPTSTGIAARETLAIAIDSLCS